MGLLIRRATQPGKNQIEENISAEGKEEKKGARLQEEDEDQVRAEDHQTPQGQRAVPPHGLSRPGMKAAKLRLEKVSRSGDIRTIRRTGRRATGKYLTAWVAGKAAGDRGISLGIVTSRGFQSAVSRNRAKRRVRGCIMDVRDLLKPGNTYLIECRPGADEEEYQILVKDIETILFGAGERSRKG